MTTRIKLRRDTAANWTSNNPILAAGEPGLETDTGKTKYGNGNTHWADLSYATGGITARQLVGSFTGYGPSIPNVSSSDIWFDTVVADPDGNAYYVGGENDTNWLVAVKVDGNGEVVWEKEIDWADGYEGAGTSAVYNTATDQVVVLAHYWKNTQGAEQDDTVVVLTLNPSTGALVGDPTVIRDDYTEDGSRYGWVRPMDIVLDSNGDPIVCGEVGNGMSITYSVTTATGSTVNDLFVDAAQFADRYPVPYNNWYVTGTNIANEIYITAVKYYDNQPTTNLAGGTGTNANFDITADGAGGYTIVLGSNAGTGYQYLNQILVLGSNLGGADGINDATVTVQGVDGGVITGVSVTGASVGSSTYTGVSGTNIASGSNATFNAQWRLKGTEVWYPDYGTNGHFGVWTNQQGSGYAIGDTIALPAASYGGSSTGTITVVNIDGAGAILDWAFTGTYNTSVIKITTDNYYGIDYGVAGGSYSINNYESESFVRTESWTKAFGSSSYDRANALDKDSSGNIYVAGQTYDLSRNNGATRGQLVKMSSTGTVVWSKNFDPVDWNWFDNGYTGVAVDSDDNIIVTNNSLVTKVDADGVVLWQKIIAQGYPIDMWNTCVDVDSDNNVYYAAEYDYMGQATNDDYLLFKFDTDGNVLWQREAGTGSEESTQWNDGYQILTVAGDRFYVCGSTYQGGDDIGLAMNLPTDGSGASNNFIGRYFYRTTEWEVTTSTAVASDMTVESRTLNLTVTTTNTFAVSTLTNVVETRAIRTGDVDGRIENLYSISFEDGTVQRTAYTGGLSQSGSSPFIYNTNNYVVTGSDAGKMLRWIAPGWNDTQWIYIPADDVYNFDIGTQIHFMKDQGIRTFFFYPAYDNNDVVIMPAQPADGMQGYAYNSGEGWSVHHENWDQIPCIVTITKVDVNRWLLSTNSATQVMDWSW